MSSAGVDIASETRPGRLGRGPRLALLLLLLGLGWLYVAHPGGGFTAGGRVHGDGVYYYAYTRSLVLDRDVDFANDYALLGDPHGHGTGPTGRAENRFAAGAGIGWIPTFVAAHAVVSLGNAAGWTEDPADGTSSLYQRITLFGSVLWGLGALALSIRLAARYVSTPIATMAGLALALASPLAWYMVYQPSWPHATDACAVAAFLWVWHEGRRGRRLRGWAGLGLLAGLTILVRTQNVALLALPGFDLGRELVAGLRRRAVTPTRHAAAAALVLLVATAATASPQLWIWSTLYGDAVVIPQGDAFMRWGASKWLEALFSSRNGLFAWSPLVGASLVGLLALGVRRPSARRVAGLLLLAFCMQAYINGSADDWWGGWAFGGRRFVGYTALYVLGCAYLLHGLHRVAVDHGRALAAAGVALVVGLFATYNASFMWDYWHARLLRARSQPLQPATERWATRMISAWYAALGHPGAVPVNLAHAWRAGVSPERYDATSGWELATDRTKPQGWDRISLHDPRWAGAGFGPATESYGLTVSWVRDHATFVLPVRYATDLEVVLQLRPARPGTSVQVELGGYPVLDRTLKTGWHHYRGSIPAAALEPGLNYARVTQTESEPGAPPPHSIGRTGATSTVEIEVVSDPDAVPPLRLTLDRTEIDIAERGVTAFVLEPGSGPDDPGYRPLGTFDTWRDVHAARRLADAVERLEPGSVVALGLAHSALHYWTPDADAALAALGGAARLARDDRRTRYALIGVRGAPPGTALETMTLEGPATARLGRPARLRHEGVAWASLTIWRPEMPLPPVVAGWPLLPARP